MKVFIPDENYLLSCMKVFIVNERFRLQHEKLSFWSVTCTVSRTLVVASPPHYLTKYFLLVLQRDAQLMEFHSELDRFIATHAPLGMGADDFFDEE